MFWPKSAIVQLYDHQIEHGRHFHLQSGQNLFGGEDPELQDVLRGTLCAMHCLTNVPGTGRIKGNNFLNKQSFLYTTSRTVHRAVDIRQISRFPNSSSRNIRNRATTPHQQARQLQLAELAASALMRDQELPLYNSELLLGEGSSSGDRNSEVEAAQQVVKRRRLVYKQPVPQPGGGQNQSGSPSWGEIFRNPKLDVSHRGRVYFNQGDEVVGQIQRLTPHFHVVHVVMARGTNRVQLPKPGLDPQDIPMRQTMVVARKDGKVKVDGGPEAWTRVPKYKRWRKGIPARISLTIYGRSRSETASRESGASSSDRRFGAEGAIHGDPPSIGSIGPLGEGCREDDRPNGAAAEPLARPMSPSSLSVRRRVEEAAPAGLEQGYPPRGPGYLNLSEQEKRELGRIHQNLGHPDAAVLVKFLEERKASPRIIQGARDFTCSVCLESVPGPKPARPSSIHVDGDFGDVIGMDVAYWTSRGGQQFMFTHIIDESTLFHQATAAGRTMEDQYEVRLQREGICAKVSAGESHWQVGRVESHGKILKSMLTRRDSQHPIATDAEFRQCLRAAVQAKNALSRVRGFTPEQAVFGKLSRLPASLVSHEQAASHALAASDLPEGLAFRQSLQRREQARIAFIQADNDNSYRRALFRKTRATLQTYVAGDWVLYWRRHRTGHRTRGERGRWVGPVQ